MRNGPQSSNVSLPGIPSPAHQLQDARSGRSARGALAGTGNRPFPGILRLFGLGDLPTFSRNYWAPFLGEFQDMGDGIVISTRLLNIAEDS